MNLQWLEDVLALLEERNLSRAAARRSITQPAFSRRIRSFEDWIGAEMLDRGTNRIKINSSLSAHEDEIRALAARIRELRGNIANHDPTSATITITAQHAPIHSKFPDLALEARRRFPSIRFRLRAGNQRDCITLFLRGDASIFLSYEALDMQPLLFGESVRRCVCGIDRLVPVVGGRLRYKISGEQAALEDLPAVTYPEDSHFGEILTRAGKPFGTKQLSKHSVCETALSGGIKEMVLKGLGVGWLPLSMCYREIESGDMISLGEQLGSQDLHMVLYANVQNEMAMDLVSLWQSIDDPLNVPRRI